MPYNKKSLLNLKRLPKGQTGNPAGRPKKLAPAIASIPADAQKRVYDVLHHALALPNVNAAKEYLESEETQACIGEYGFLLQIAIRSLMGKTGWLTANDILDRLFGKPKQTTQLSGGISVGDKPVIMFEQEPVEEDAQEEAEEENQE